MIGAVTIFNDVSGLQYKLGVKNGMLELTI